MYNSSTKSHELLSLTPSLSLSLSLFHTRSNHLSSSSTIPHTHTHTHTYTPTHTHVTLSILSSLLWEEVSSKLQNSSSRIPVGVRCSPFLTLILCSGLFQASALNSRTPILVSCRPQIHIRTICTPFFYLFISIIFCFMK